SVKGASLGAAVLHRIYLPVQALGQGLIPENARGNRAVRGSTLIIQENGNELFPVEGDAQRLAQLAVALLLLGRISLAHHRIPPVETQVVDLGLRRGVDLDPVI